MHFINYIGYKHDDNLLRRLLSGHVPNHSSYSCTNFHKKTLRNVTSLTSFTKEAPRLSWSTPHAVKRTTCSSNVHTPRLIRSQSYIQSWGTVLRALTDMTRTFYSLRGVHPCSPLPGYWFILIFMNTESTRTDRNATLELSESGTFLIFPQSPDVLEVHHVSVPYIGALCSRLI